MKRTTLLLCLCFLATSLGAFWAGVWYSSEDGRETSGLSEKEIRAFSIGREIARGRAAWLRAAENDLYRRLTELDRSENLPYDFSMNRWFTIADLHRFVENPHVRENDRSSAEAVLKKTVFYFYENPDVRKRIAKDLGLPDNIENSGTGKESGYSLSEIESFADLDAALENTNPRHLDIRRTLDQLIESRFFPGREKIVSGRKIFIPGGTGSSGSSGETFEFHIDSRKANYDGENLIVDGVSYGKLGKRDEVDFRVPGKVFINGKDVTR